MIRVAIVDDHPILRRALRAYLEGLGDMQVVGDAANGRDAIDLLRAHDVDVLLLDVDMPGYSGLDALPRIKARAPRLRVLVFSGHPEELYAVALLREGASGYLNKSCEPADIAAAIRRVAEGRRWISPGLAQQLADEALAPVAAPQLSRRELQVLLRLARGRSTGEVALDLNVSPKTVGTHRRQLMRKLGARTSSDLTYYALKHRLVE